MAAGLTKSLAGIVKTASGSYKLSDETTNSLYALAQKARAKPSYLTSASANQGISDTINVKARFFVANKADDVVEEAVEVKPLTAGKVADNSSTLDKAAGNLNGKTGNVLDSAKSAGTTNPAKFSTYAKSALIGASTFGLLSVAGGISSQKEGGGEQVIVPGGEGSQTTYNYYTGNEAVDESLNWLQLQIDELTKAFNDLLDTLFGGGSGGGTESTPWDFLTYDGGEGSGGIGAAIGRIISNPLVIIGAVAVLALAIVLYRRKSGGKKKKGGKK